MHTQPKPGIAYPQTSSLLLLLQFFLLSAAPRVGAGEEALTINGAWLQGFDEITGSIEEGKNADFIIVDKNIFEIPVNEISDTKVLQTYFQGNKVYDSTLIQQPDHYDELVETVEEIIDDEEFLMALN